MNKSELTTALFKRIGGTRAAAKNTVDALAAIITEQLQRGETVTLHSSLGHFSVKSIPERQGRNPKTGESLKIAAHIKPFFKPNTILKKALNQ